MKKSIIIISIIVGLLALLAVLFGAVFCLYNQKVTVVGEDIEISNDRILELANFKNGQSIFSINKDDAIKNIEENEVYLKVIHIKTTDLQTVEFVVRKRVKTYYALKDGSNFIMDEDLKLLEITAETPSDLIRIDEKLLDLNGKKVADFISGDLSHDVAYNTFVALMSVCQKKVDGQTQYYSRSEVCEFINSINIEKGYTTEFSYDRLILETSYGVKFDIGKPNEDLNRKMNMCFSAMQNLDDSKLSTGRIKITYLNNGEEHFGWQAQ